MSIMERALESTPCEYTRISEFESDATVELWCLVQDIANHGFSDWMVPEQFSNDPAVCTWLDAFMVDPVHGQSRIEELGLPYEGAIENFITSNAWLSWPDEHRFTMLMQIRRFWGWRHYFNRAQPEHTETLESVEVRSNGQASEFAKELWDTLQADTHGRSQLEVHIAVRGVDPSTGLPLEMDDGEGALQSRNMLWLQSIVAGLSLMTTPEFNLLQHSENTRTAVLGMHADRLFLKAMVGDCEERKHL